MRRSGCRKLTATTAGKGAGDEDGELGPAIKDQGPGAMSRPLGSPAVPVCRLEG